MSTIYWEIFRLSYEYFDFVKYGLKSNLKNTENRNTFRVYFEIERGKRGFKKNVCKNKVENTVSPDTSKTG